MSAFQSFKVLILINLIWQKRNNRNVCSYSSKVLLMKWNEEMLLRKGCVWWTCLEFWGKECHLKSNQQELEHFYDICFNMKICIQENETSQINDHMDPHQNYKAYLNKNLCCRIENQSKPPLFMNENSCRLIKHGKHCMQSSWCWYKWEKHFIYKETTDKKACGPEGEECWTLWRVEWMKKKKNPQTNKK